MPGSFSIGAGASLPVWAAWVAPYDAPILLVGDESTDYRAARRALARVGLDEVRGYLKGGIRSWIEAGCEQAHLPQMDVSELSRCSSGACVVDVRSPGEWRGGHVRGARHIFAVDLAQRLEELPQGETVHLICGSG